MKQQCEQRLNEYTYYSITMLDIEDKPSSYLEMREFPSI